MIGQQWQCIACEGTYWAPDASGRIHQHACAPALPDDDGIERELPNKRDENILRDRRRLFVSIVSEGNGVTCLTNSKLVEPEWLAQLKKQLAKREEQENA